jgi:DNA-binding response OmpR family regulator
MAIPFLNSAPRILVVDDDADLRMTLDQLLTQQGYAVCHADSGEEAISMFARRPLALIITQLMLGGNDSLEIIAEMRRELVCARFIATARPSWLPTECCARVAAQLGACCVLLKPFLPEQLLAAVRDALSLNRKTQCPVAKPRCDLCPQP